VPKNCQQKLSSTYKASGQRYDRGHLVPANHLDFSERAITQSNFMTNILPQAANMNRGAWLRTEVITECLRDISDLLVMGGPLWDRKQKDEFFERSHGVKTPDAFWKVIIRDKRVIAWIIPNSQSAKSTELDRYLVSVEDIERIAKVSIPVEDYLKYDAEKSSWLVPRGCNKG
jgi:endonuclease G